MKPSTSTQNPAAEPSRPIREGQAKRSPQGSVPKSEPVPEIGGRKGPDPTRYGDWEKDGRCVDF